MVFFALAFQYALALASAAPEVHWTQTLHSAASSTWETAALAQIDQDLKRQRAQWESRCMAESGKFSCEKPWVNCQHTVGEFVDCQARQKCQCESDPAL